MKNGLPLPFDHAFSFEGTGATTGQQVLRLWEQYYLATAEVAEARLCCSFDLGLCNTCQSSVTKLDGVCQQGNSRCRRNRLQDTLGVARVNATCIARGDGDRQYNFRQVGQDINNQVQSHGDLFSDGSRVMDGGRPSNGIFETFRLPLSPRYQSAGFQGNEAMASMCANAWMCYYQACIRIARDVIRRYHEFVSEDIVRGGASSHDQSGSVRPTGDVPEALFFSAPGSSSIGDSDRRSSSSESGNGVCLGRRSGEGLGSDKDKVDKSVVDLRCRAGVDAYLVSSLTSEEKTIRNRQKRAKKKNKAKGVVPQQFVPAVARAESLKEYQCLQRRSRLSGDYQVDEGYDGVVTALSVAAGRDSKFKKVGFSIPDKERRKKPGLDDWARLRTL